MKKIFFIMIFVISVNFAQSEKISDDSQACIDCHTTIHPGIVEDWKSSRHSKTTLNTALTKELLSRRVSVKELPTGNDGKTVVGCFECHALNAEDHKDNFEHFGYNINVIVSPDDCKLCHPDEVKQYSGTKKAHAAENLLKNPLYSTLVQTVISVKELKNDQLTSLPVSHFTMNESCYACHGTVVEVNGLRTVQSDLGEIEVPDLKNWPNQGVRRINPDGGLGACTSCHPRHSFSIEVARKPYTCGQCHLEPDVPAYNVYKESKHGNIYDSYKSSYNWSEVPWKVGEDFKTPTCASCHNSLITTSDGTVIAERSHDFADRLWVRIFGLIYSHPQPKSGKTFEILNGDGLPMPVTFDNKPATDFLISQDEQNLRKEKMTAVCKSCHSTSWVEHNFKKFDNTLFEADEMVRTSTAIMKEAWQKGLENNNNPFDEQIELLWQRQWLFYGNSLKYASAMMGPDYAAFKNGWWELSQNLQKMHDLIKLKSMK